MKRVVTVILLLLSAALLGTPVGIAQEASPVDDASVPEGALANDSRFFFRGGLEDVDEVHFILMTNWEMDSEGAAERFFAVLRENVSSDLTVKESGERLLDRNDDQVLIAGADQLGGPVTVVLFQQGTYVGTWLAVGDEGQDVILANLYNEFFGGGFDPAHPFPTEADLPEGYGPAGAADQVDAAGSSRGLLPPRIIS
jgi:hypothetical protein